MKDFDELLKTELEKRVYGKVKIYVHDFYFIINVINNEYSWFKVIEWNEFGHLKMGELCDKIVHLYKHEILERFVRE